MYPINKATWQNHGVGRMGLTNFTAETQDLIAVSMLNGLGVIGKIKDGDLEAATSEASKLWAALPEGPGKSGRHHQPFVEFKRFEATYKAAGGTVK